jgi:hypothetical protein
MTDIADPRIFPSAAGVADASLYALAAASLGETSTARAERIDRTVTAQLAQRLESGDAFSLAAEVDAAPSVAIARHLWRRLIDAWQQASRASGAEELKATMFAIPVVIVAGNQSSAAVPPVDGVLRDPERICVILREHGAVGGSQTFALASTLAAAEAIGVSRWSVLLRWQREAFAGNAANRDLAPAPIALPAGHEAAHLRFVVGTALAAPNVDLLATADIGAWALPLARELGQQIAVPGASLLALPRTPALPPVALQQGRAVQRAVGAQLFASNAIRRLRASVGEPCAVISAHHCPTAPGGGELRLSLSSAFDPRQAEGFRCPLYPTDAAGDVASMLIELMRDCRVDDVRVRGGVHADRDASTGLTLLFKSDLAAANEVASLH